MSEFAPVHDHGSRPYDWVGAWSERRAALSPEKVGLVDETTGREFTYAELDERANRAARALRDHGVEDGERVAVVSRNRPELVDLFFACGKTGGVLAPLSHRLAPRELGELLATVDPELLVVEDPFADRVADALSRVDLETSVRGLGDTEWLPYERDIPEDGSPVESAALSMDDPCLFLHTGGSTGVPKETVVTHGGVLWNSINTITAWGLRDDDVTPMVFPMFHTGGWNVLTLPLFHMGGTVVLSREFDAGAVLNTIDERDVSVLVAVPAVLRMMAEHDAWPATDLSSIRFAKSGGGPCRDAVIDRWFDRGVDLSQGYGLTECGPNNFTMPDGWPREKTESVGVPAMHVDARAVVLRSEPLDHVGGERPEIRLDAPVVERPRDEAGLAEELRDEPRLGLLEDDLRPADLLDAPAVDDCHAVGDRQRFLLVVGHGDGRDARLLDDPADLLAHLDAEAHVEVRERFVEQEYVRLGRQRPGERDALALAARQVVRRRVAVVAQVHQIEQFLDAGLALVARPVVDAEGDVLADGEVRKEGERLEDQPDVAVVGRDEGVRAGDDLVVDADDTPVGVVEAGEQAQRRRLAAARRTQQGEQLALVDRQRQLVDGGLGAELAGDAVEGEHRVAVVLVAGPHAVVGRRGDCLLDHRRDSLLVSCPPGPKAQPSRARRRPRGRTPGRPPGRTSRPPRRAR